MALEVNAESRTILEVGHLALKRASKRRVRQLGE
jgi:hypothetical protein